MKNTLIMLCILCASFNGMAQDKDFDLSKYKFPDYKRHQLDFNFNSRGSNTSWSDYVFDSDGVKQNIDYQNSSGNSYLNLLYTTVRSTRIRVENISSYVDGSTYFSKSVDETGTKKFNNQSINLGFSAIERYYLKENSWFVEVNPNFDFSLWAANDKNQTTDKFQSSGNNFSINLGIGGGIGRIEDVTEFWQAYYILEGLKKHGLLDRNPSLKDVTDLATLASQLKSKRFFDFRIKKMEEMTSLDSMMRQSGFIEHSDIAYFNIMNDYWSFANVSNRSSGKILKVMVTPMVSHRFDNPYFDENRTQNSTYLNSGLYFQCAKQINLFWERNFNFNLTNKSTIDTDETSFYKLPKNYLKLNSTFGYSFYPNFRTIVRTYLNYNAKQYSHSLNQSNTEYLKSWSTNLSLNAQVNYYISPQLTVQGNFAANYVDEEQNISQKDKLYLSYNLGFTYAIF
ncbi:MAG: hypothetical protein WAO52_13260 [Prolixibacteraceae bacterium]